MRWLISLVLTVVMVVSMSAASVADPGDAAAPQLKAWTADVTPEVLADLHEADLDISAEEPIDDDTIRVEVIATAPQIASARGPDAKFTATRGQLLADRTPDIADGENVFRPYDGPTGIEAELVAIANANPDLVKLVDIGDTVQGRDIWALKVTKNANRRPDGQRPAVLYSANQHAREWITVEMTRRLLRHYLDGYDTDPEIARLVDRNELWFVVSANPDGYQYTHTDERLWRKNLRDNDGDGEVTNADGVDLNRNLSYKWGYDNEGSSPNATSQTYRGPGPGSEPETQAMDGLLGDIDFAWQVNYHSAAELLLYGIGWQVATPSPDDVVYEAIAGDDANPAVPGYDPDISAELYTTNGETTNHAQAVHDTLSFTPEMSTCQTASNSDPDDEWVARDCQSGFNFPDDEGLIQREFEANIPFALDVARSAADPGHPVSHLGNTAPPMVVDDFAVSHATRQQIQVVANRDIPKVRMAWTVNGGRRQYRANTAEWDGGERYGSNFDIYYQYLRGTVTGTSPGDEVTVWFEAGRDRTEPFTYTVADDIGGDVLVLADTDYGHELSGGVTDLRYLDYYTDALEANGYTWDLYDVRATDAAPDPLGVLDHYDAVVWYGGDNLVNDYQGGSNSTVIVQDMQVALRDYLNEGGKLLATGKNAGFQDFFPIDYGENADPDTVCTSGDCLSLSNDFFQYWLGGWNRTRRGGLGADGEALDVNGRDTPYAGLGWTLDGGDSAMNQGSAGGTNATGTGTASWAVTSDILPVDEFPQFESWGSAEWVGDSGAFEPLTGEQYMASQAADISWKRLARTVDLTGATSGSVDVNVSHDTEGDWDFVVVEAHTVGQDDWTTLPVAGVTSQDTGASCEAGWQDELHPFLGHYQTLNSDGSCSPTGTTGEWNAVSGDGDGWQEWSIDLSAYAGSQVEISISYISDWGTQGTGVFVDDTSVVVDGAVTAETSFEDGLDGWSVPGPPEGSAANANDWIRTEALVLAWATVTTPDSVVQGFGFEGISTEAERNAVMGRTLDHLLD